MHNYNGKIYKRKTKTFSIREDLIEDLKAVSARKNMSMSRIVENLIIKEYKKVFADDLNLSNKNDLDD